MRHLPEEPRPSGTLWWVEAIQARPGGRAGPRPETRTSGTLWYQKLPEGRGLVGASGRLLVETREIETFWDRLVIARAPRQARFVPPYAPRHQGRRSNPARESSREYAASAAGEQERSGTIPRPHVPGRKDPQHHSTDDPPRSPGGERGFTNRRSSCRKPFSHAALRPFGLLADPSSTLVDQL